MFQDIGFGILLSIFMSWLFDVPLTAFLVFVSLICTLLPDIDMFVYFFNVPRLKKLFGGTQGHRGITHYPIVYIFFSIFLWIFAGAFISILFFVGTFYHLLHDSYGLGWGIQWLWPFSTRRYKFFSTYGSSLSLQPVISWSEQEHTEIVKKYAVPHWFSTFYFHLNWVSLSEYSVLIFSLIMLYLYLH